MSGINHIYYHFPKARTAPWRDLAEGFLSRRVSSVLSPNISLNLCSTTNKTTPLVSAFESRVEPPRLV